MTQNLLPKELKLLTSFQTSEITSAFLYFKIAKRIKDKQNKKILLRIAKEEIAHSYIWQQYTQQEPKPNFFKLFFWEFLSIILGYTFVIKLIETNEYKNIQLIYVTPYLTLTEQTKIKQMQAYGLCDASIYPPIENTPPRFAISKRNEWMMANSELIIAYVNRDYGGAYKALQVAKRGDKRIINICELA